MKKIYKNNKEYLRFKIGDEFKNFTGKSSVKKLIDNNEFSYVKNNPFIFPVYTNSISGDHIIGWTNKFNFDGEKTPAIRYVVAGNGAGATKYIDEKIFTTTNANVLVSNYSNEYIALYLEKAFKSMTQGSTQPNLTFKTINGLNFDIPSSHKKIALVIKKINQHKQISKQLREQLEDYKLSILQATDKIVKTNMENNVHGKYLRFKIIDEFKEIAGKGSFNQMKKEGIASDSFDAERGFIYPVYSGSTIGNAINGYSKEYNHDGVAIKVSKDGAGAGHSILVSGKTFNGSGSFYLTSKLANEYFALLFDNLLPRYQQGSAIPHVYFRDFKDKYIYVTNQHNHIAVILSKINDWEQLINATTEKINMYISGILKYTIKGEKNE